jgi:hypothetical protein
MRNRMMQALAVVVTVLAAVMVPVAPAHAGWTHWERIALDRPNERGQQVNLTYRNGGLYADVWTSDPGQSWHFIAVLPDNDIYEIRNGATNTCLTVLDTRANTVGLQACTGSNRSRWQVQLGGGRVYRLANVADSPTSCLYYPVDVEFEPFHNPYVSNGARISATTNGCGSDPFYGVWFWWSF